MKEGDASNNRCYILLSGKLVVVKRKLRSRKTRENLLAQLKITKA